MLLRIDPRSLLQAEEKLTRPLTNAGPLMTQLAADLERSVRANFRAGGRPVPWLPSRRAMETGRPTLIAMGLLLNSIFRRHTGYEATVFTRDKRAAIHEYGGTIRPRAAKALTIPLCAAARGRKARSFRDTFLLKREGKAPVIMQKQEKGEPRALYMLLTSVTIPARPYMDPPPQDIDKMMKRIRNWMLSGGKTT